MIGIDPCIPTIDSTFTTLLSRTLQGRLRQPRKQGTALTLRETPIAGSEELQTVFPSTKDLQGDLPLLQQHPERHPYHHCPETPPSRDAEDVKGQRTRGHADPQKYIPVQIPLPVRGTGQIKPRCYASFSNASYVRRLNSNSLKINVSGY